CRSHWESEIERQVKYISRPCRRVSPVLLLTFPMALERGDAWPIRPMLRREQAVFVSAKMYRPRCIGPASLVRSYGRGAPASRSYYPVQGVTRGMEGATAPR